MLFLSVTPTYTHPLWVFNTGFNCNNNSDDKIFKIFAAHFFKKSHKSLHLSYYSCKIHKGNPVYLTPSNLILFYLDINKVWSFLIIRIDILKVPVNYERLLTSRGRV